MKPVTSKMLNYKVEAKTIKLGCTFIVMRQLNTENCEDILCPGARCVPHISGQDWGWCGPWWSSTGGHMGTWSNVQQCIVKQNDSFFSHSEQLLHEGRWF